MGKGRRNGGTWGHLPSQSLADQLTLFHQGEQIMFSPPLDFGTFRRLCGRLELEYVPCLLLQVYTPPIAEILFVEIFRAFLVCWFLMNYF